MSAIEKAGAFLRRRECLTPNIAFDQIRAVEFDAWQDEEKLCLQLGVMAAYAAMSVVHRVRLLNREPSRSHNGRLKVQRIPVRS
jgi:hypothetical protein